MTSAPNYLALHQQQRSANFGAMLGVGALMLGAAAVALMIYASFRYYIGVPFEDQWRVIEDLAGNHGVYSLPLLWSLHNEHRIPFAKLLMTADLYWFKGRNVSLFLELYVMQFAHLGMFVLALRRAAAWPQWMIGMGAGLAAFALFWISQWESLLNPFEVSFLAAFLGATFAVVALMFALETPQKFSWWLVASIGATFISEASLANGLLVWPLLLLFAIRYRLRPILIVALGGAASFCIALYLYGYHRPPWHANPVESLGKPLLVSQYLLAYFGNPWASLSVLMGQAFAVVGIAAATVLYLWHLLRSKTKTFAFAMLSLCMFLLVTGFLTALGRIHLPLVQATASRYQTPVLLFWLCLALYAVDTAYRLQPRYTLAVSTAVLILTVAILPSSLGALANAQEVTKQVKAGTLPVLADVKDDEQLKTIFPVPDVIFKARPFLRQNKTTFYSEHEYQWLGKPLNSVFLLASFNRCFGEDDRSRQVLDPQFPGWELYGWAWDHQAMRPVEELVAVTDAGTISGIGVSGFARPDVHNVYKEVSDPAIGWRLYIQGAQNFTDVKVYGVVDGGKAVCLVKPPFSLPVLKH